MQPDVHRTLKQLSVERGETMIETLSHAIRQAAIKQEGYVKRNRSRRAARARRAANQASTANAA